MLVTVGHGTASKDELVTLLRGTAVELVVDVRRYPGSRRHPHAARTAMESWLPAAGIQYRWEPRLGGRRNLSRDVEGDRWWRVEAFRAYAAHTRTPEFTAAVDELISEVALREGSVAVMCSEALWWRCHRRLIADVAVLLHGMPVQHLLHNGRLVDHVPAAGARIGPSGLHYDEEPAMGSTGEGPEA